MARIIARKRSSQELFESPYWCERDPATRRPLSGERVSLQEMLRKHFELYGDPSNNPDVERNASRWSNIRYLFADYLFTRIIVEEGSAAIPHFACVAELGGVPCLFWGAESGHTLSRAVPTGRRVKVDFATSKNAEGGNLIEVLVASSEGDATAIVAGADLHVRGSHFERFLNCVVEAKVVQVFYPNVDRTAAAIYRNGYSYVPVGFFARRRIAGLIKRWPKKSA